VSLITELRLQTMISTRPRSALLSSPKLLMLESLTLEELLKHLKRLMLPCYTQEMNMHLAKMKTLNKVVLATSKCMKRETLCTAQK